ncbi:MAG: sulfoxide reductase heme-binding subunit YedZ [Gemmatimonadetes bacterium]|nr:sulfoxide reductase heme-binding subunit YedZ [Gemmatimonadota bacterium]
MRTKRVVLALKVLLWVGALTPTVWLGAGAYWGWLGANPVEKLEHVTGMSALIGLLATLLVTPLRRVTGWNPLIRLRRPIGLFAFYYVALHFSIWMGLDLGLNLSWITDDIRKRPYITVGFTGFLLLIPLALTSTRKSIRRLGKRWVTLHRLIYVVPALGVIHYYWSVKADVRIPILMGVIYATLMLVRIPGWVESRARRSARAARARREPRGSPASREGSGTVPVGATD